MIKFILAQVVGGHGPKPRAETKAGAGTLSLPGEERLHEDGELHIDAEAGEGGEAEDMDGEGVCGLKAHERGGETNVG